MSYAVIQSGGKQYVVQAGQRIKVEKMAADEGKKVQIKEVLLTATDKDFALGAPFVKGAVVEANVLRHGQADKITGVKMKAKKRLKKYFGHRQEFTELEIIKITN